MKVINKKRRRLQWGCEKLWFHRCLVKYRHACILYPSSKQVQSGIPKWTHRYTQIAQTLSSSINTRRVICCNHTQSIASGSREAFHTVWIHPSLSTQCCQFKCKSWHSHHSAVPHQPRSKWDTIYTTVHIISLPKCVGNAIVKHDTRKK